AEAWLIALGMLVLSVLVALLQAAQARLAPQHESLRARALIAGLCYLQPLVRSWVRYRTRLFSYRVPFADPEHLDGRTDGFPLHGAHMAAYWSEDWRERTELLDRVIAYLNEHRWGRVIDSGWSDWDLEVYCSPWVIVRVCTAEEDRGSGKRFIRIRYGMRPSQRTKAVAMVALLAAVTALTFTAWAPAVGAALLLAIGAWLWRGGTRRAAQVVGIFDY